ncbi:MAG: endopeptidase La [bacterium]
MDLTMGTLEGDEESTSRIEIPDELNMLPLRDSVIFPMLVAPLSVGRDASIQLVDESVVGGNRIIGVVAQKDANAEQPTFADVYGYGTAVIVRMLGKVPEGARLIVQGISRIKIIQGLQEEPYLRARVEVIPEPDIPEADMLEVEALKRQIINLFERAIFLSPDMPEELRSITMTITEPGSMADLITAHMRLTVEQKQLILETIPIKERLRKVLEMLSREVQVLELGSKLQTEVAGEMTKTQREYYLREQLKAIQRELGEGEDRGEDIDDLRKRIIEAKMPEEAQREAERELDRLARMSPGSPENTVARTYIEWMIALPWSVATEDNLDIAHVKQVLDNDHYGLPKVKERILEFLSVRKFKKDGNVRQPILCFVGPPGVGKTSLSKSVARAMGRNFIRLSLGGMRDEAEIRGHRRTYVGALPGQIIQSIRRAGSNNPVMGLDEVDKIGTDWRGDPSSALLEVLDPEQNFSFRDHYLDVPFDLSKVFFITTANVLETVPPPLRDRMEIIEISGYTDFEKLHIAKQHIIPKQMTEHGLTEEQVIWNDDAVLFMSRRYTRESGVRNLERTVAAVCRKITRKYAEGLVEEVTVTPAVVEEFLGLPRYPEDAAVERELAPGVAVGLAWTPSGGDVLFIESTLMSGSKNLILTGQLGDVMKESAQASLSFIRSHADKLGIDPGFYDKHDIHIHVPEGAIPKDGPSAGITMTTALASLLTNRRIKPRLAMTGEVTLTGQVLPVGGIREKVMAAKRAGVNSLILPKRNEKDVAEEVPEEAKKGITFHFVDRVEEVLKIALDSKP